MAVVAMLSKGYDLDYIWKQVDRGPAKDGTSYYIHLFLEDTRRAQALLEAATTAHRDHSKPQAIVLGNLALALIRQGDLDEAAGRLHQAIDVIEMPAARCEGSPVGCGSYSGAGHRWWACRR